MAEQKRRGGSKKDLRSGRDKAYYKWWRDYRSRPNKLRKLNRHLAAHPADGVAIAALARVKAS